MIDVAEYKRHPPKPGMTYLREPSAFDMQDPIIVRLMQPADLDTLQSICRRAYSENFGHHWQEEGLSEYLEKVFGTNILIPISGSMSPSVSMDPIPQRPPLPPKAPLHKSPWPSASGRANQ